MTATVSGWGWTNPDYSSQAAELQSVDVDIMSHKECESHYHRGEITNKMMCAKTRGGDSCYGDSGGPLTTLARGRSVLVGVVSWGRECARPQWPGVYSKVDTVLEWIRENTYDAEWCAEAAFMGHDNRGDRRAGR